MTGGLCRAACGQTRPSGPVRALAEICRAVISPRTHLPGRILFAGQGPAFQLYLGAQSQAVSAKRGARRQTLWFEISHINLVEITPLDMSASMAVHLNTWSRGALVLTRL